MGLPKRGQVWFVSLDPVEGHEMGKERPAVIISNDKNNQYAGTITMIPLTLRTAKIYPFEVFLPKEETGLPKDSKAKCSQIRTIDKKRLINFIGTLSFEKLKELEQAFLIHLDINV